MLADDGRLKLPLLGKAVHVADLLFALACAGAVVVLYVLGSGLSFNHDEWVAIAQAGDWSWDELMFPHNEHWSLGLKLIYKSLLATVGLSSYMPYLVVLFLLHIATAMAIYVYGRRQTTALVALAAGLVFLALGSGAENLLWGFQVGFVGSAASGAWALVILLREPAPRHPIMAAILLLTSVATSGVGLFFLAAAGTVLLVSPQRRRLLWTVIPALVAYGAWYLAYGRHALVIALPDPQALAAFTRNGIAFGMGEITGWGQDIGLIVVVLLALAALGSLALGDTLRLGLVAGSVGLIAEWTLIGLGRAGWIPESFSSSRYVYVSAVFLLVAFVSLIAGRRFGEPAQRVRFAAIVATLVGISVAWNAGRAYVISRDFMARAQEYRAAFVVMTQLGGSNAVPDDWGLAPVAGAELGVAKPGDWNLVPPTAELRELFARYGSPIRDPLALRGTTIPTPVIDEQFWKFVSESLVISNEARPEGTAPLGIESSSDLDVGRDGTCTTLQPQGEAPRIVARVPSGSALYAVGDGVGVAEVSFALHEPATSPGRRFEMQPGTAARIAIPDIGPARTMWLRLEPPREGTTRLCLSSSGGVVSTGDGVVSTGDPPSSDRSSLHVAASVVGSVSVPGWGELVVEEASDGAGAATLAPQVVLSNDVTIAPGQAGCVTSVPAGADPYLSVSVPDGHSLRVTPLTGGPAQIFIDDGAGYSETLSIRVTMAPRAYDIHMPPGSDPGGWPIRVDPPADQPTTICVVPIVRV